MRNALTSHEIDGSSSACKGSNLQRADVRQPRRNPYNYYLKKDSVINRCYRIKSALGHGGMGEVYLAEDTRLQRDVAVKILLPAIATHNAAEDFHKEARLQGNLEHDSIIAVHYTGYDSDCDVHFIVMEYVDGEAINARLKRGETYSEYEALSLCLKIASAMGAVRYKEMPVVHRDIKPANIMLSRDGKIKIADWGIARFGEANPEEDRNGNKGVIGTPAYISPEQILSPDSVDARADIYSLGITLYELLTGKRPYDGNSPEEIIRKAVKGPFADIKWELPNVSGAIVKLLHRMMARDLEKRPRDWGHLVALLHHTFNHLEASRPPSPLIRRWQAIFRNLRLACRWKYLMAFALILLLSSASLACCLLAEDDGMSVQMLNHVKSFRMNVEQKFFFQKHFKEIPWEVMFLNTNDLDKWIKVWKDSHLSKTAI